MTSPLSNRDLRYFLHSEQICKTLKFYSDSHEINVHVTSKILNVIGVYVTSHSITDGKSHYNNRKMAEKSDNNNKNNKKNQISCYSYSLQWSHSLSVSHWSFNLLFVFVCALSLWIMAGNPWTSNKSYFMHFIFLHIARIQSDKQSHDFFLCFSSRNHFVPAEYLNQIHDKSSKCNFIIIKKASALCALCGVHITTATSTFSVSFIWYC